MRFQYQAEEKSGRVKRGEVEAQDQDEARRLLRERGFTHIAFQGAVIADVQPWATPWSETVAVGPTTSWQQWHWKRIGAALVLLMAVLAGSFAVRHEVVAEPLYHLHVEGQLLLRGERGSMEPVPTDLRLRLRVRCGRFVYTINPEGGVFRIHRKSRSRRRFPNANYASHIDTNGRYTIDVAVRLRHVPTGVGLSIRGSSLREKVHGMAPVQSENRLVVKLGISVLSHRHRSASGRYLPAVEPLGTAKHR